MKMKKNLLILLLVALAAVIGYSAGYWFSAQRHHGMFRSTEQIMQWLQSEYQLTPGQYRAIKILNEDFRPIIRQRFAQLHEKRDLVKKLENDPAAVPEAVSKAREDAREAREDIRNLLKEHVQAVASLMSPDQAARYLKKMAEHNLSK